MASFQIHKFLAKIINAQSSRLFNTKSINKSLGPQQIFRHEDPSLWHQLKKESSKMSSSRAISKQKYLTTYILMGGFHLVAKIIRELKCHMIPYKFKCSHWLKLQHSDWRANLVKDFFYKLIFHQ